MSRGLDRMRHSPATVGALVGGLSGIVVLNVVLLPGYTWFYDFLFVPHLPLSSHVLGTDGSVPRAVPTDAVVALLSTALPGDLLQALALGLVFVLAGTGCARLCSTAGGAAAAALAATWNPYVIERLVIGHWSFLLGYACLPWIYSAGRDLVAGHQGAGRRLIGWLAIAGLAGSTSAVIAAIMAVVAVSWSWTGGTAVVARRVAGVLGVTAVVGAAWLVPSLARPGGVPADPAGVEAFAARSDSPWGTWGSLMTLGGIWHQPSWPGSRGSVLTVGVALLVVIAVLAICAGAGLAQELAPLALAGAVGLVVAGAASLPGGTEAVEWIVTTVPGAGLVRDGQKVIALLAVLLAVASGRAVDTLLTMDRSPGTTRDAFRIVAVALLFAPIVTLPDAPETGVAMGSVDLSPDVLDARAYLDGAEPGAVAVLPWTLYRRFDWNDDRVSLDPWNRLLDRRVLVDDDLQLSDVTVRGEDSAAAEIGSAVRNRDVDLREALRREGVRWVVIHTDQPDLTSTAERLSGAPRRTFGKVQVVDLRPGQASGPTDTSRIPIVVTFVTVALAIVAWSVGGLRDRRAGTRRSDER